MIITVFVPLQEYLKDSIILPFFYILKPKKDVLKKAVRNFLLKTHKYILEN